MGFYTIHKSVVFCALKSKAACATMTEYIIWLWFILGPSGITLTLNTIHCLTDTERPAAIIVVPLQSCTDVTSVVAVHVSTIQKLIDRLIRQLDAVESGGVPGTAGTCAPRLAAAYLDI